MPESTRLYNGHTISIVYFMRAVISYQGLKGTQMRYMIVPIYSKNGVNDVYSAKERENSLSFSVKE